MRSYSVICKVASTNSSEELIMVRVSDTPQLRIGAFAPPSSLARSMYVVVLDKFTTQLSDCVNKLCNELEELEKISSTESREQNGPVVERSPQAQGCTGLGTQSERPVATANAVILACSALKDEARWMSERVDHFRHLLRETHIL